MRDRNGLPDTVGFWKTRIEERDSDTTFNVGLVYGSSGCGKSSTMKAGLLPRLSADIVTFYLEATPDQTESTLLGMIRKGLSAERIRFDESLDLVGLLTAIRRGRMLPANKKLLIVIDQFEQWLYAHTELTRVEGLVSRFVNAAPSLLPSIVKQLDAHRKISSTYLKPLLEMNAETLEQKRTLLHARLASVVDDDSMVEPLLEELLSNQIAYVGSIRERLQQYASKLTPKLWDLLRNETLDTNRRFRASMALAGFVPESELDAWGDQDLTFVAKQLVGSNAENQPLVREYLRPIRTKIISDLEKLFYDPIDWSRCMRRIRARPYMVPQVGCFADGTKKKSN